MERNLPATETALQGAFPLVSYDISDGELCQTKIDISNPSSQVIEVREMSNISKNKHDHTVDIGDMTIRAYNLFWAGSSKFYTSLSLVETSLLSLTFFLYRIGWPVCCFKVKFSINYNFVPYLCLYVFYFILFFT
jgi:hypothetical protein